MDAQGGPRPLRVVYLDHVARLSGGELALARLLPALHPHVEPLVILGEDGPLVGHLRRAGIPVEVLPLAPAAREVRKDAVGARVQSFRAALLTASYAVRLARRLAALKPDLVHTNSLKAGFYGGIAARLTGIPAIWHLRDRLAPDYLPAAAISLTRLALAVLPQAVLCNSETTMATAGRTARRPAVVASPVVRDAYAAAAEPAMSPAGPFVVGMVGRLAPWKGQDVFLRAFALAFPEGPVRARIVGSAMFGEDAFAADLQSLVSSLGLDGRVELTGFREGVESELALLSVLVHASVTPEPFGQVVVEGMAAGLPVVAAAAGGPLEIIDDGVDGLLTPPGDVAALAVALARLAHSPELRLSLGRAALQSAKRYRPEVVARPVIEVYHSVLSQHPARTGRLLSRWWSA